MWAGESHRVERVERLKLAAFETPQAVTENSSQLQCQWGAKKTKLEEKLGVLTGVTKFIQRGSGSFKGMERDLECEEGIQGQLREWTVKSAGLDPSKGWKGILSVKKGFKVSKENEMKETQDAEYYGHQQRSQRGGRNFEAEFTKIMWALELVVEAEDLVAERCSATQKYLNAEVTSPRFEIRGKLEDAHPRDARDARTQVLLAELVNARMGWGTTYLITIERALQRSMEAR
ncbi:hypothetical protein B0H16DRAFT_1468584 [Mycena metata]|uniref:Uncharacterized protein n=1 Tax=Mycena metata TaxID=1033252 RepID=A0AAD7I0H7_9AGAR|nr:hypothetical protein B0H16DRAFT_1468584 [Mycena metata]